MFNYNNILELELKIWEEWSLESYNFLKEKKEWQQLIINFKEIMNMLDKLMYLSQSSDYKMNINKRESIFSKSVILKSTLKTLDTILYCLDSGKESDAYILLRKFRDDLIFYLYLEIKTNLLINDNKNYLIFKNEKIENWLMNQLKNMYWHDCLLTVRKNENVKIAVEKFKIFNEEDYKDNILNDYVHANGIDFYNKDMWKYNDDKIVESAKKINKKVNIFFKDFLFALILLKPMTIMTTDYEDYLDNGVIPPMDTQYELAPFVCEYMHLHFERNEMEYLYEVTNMRFV